ncbi:Dihydropteroate synthase [Auricularia subglabra TFB-10046 SS5]|nr:Dihydropteroate synthase [Auricularia subglabra TFB-10046 SS5]
MAHDGADIIAVRDLAVRACIGKTAWDRPDAEDKAQPVLVSVWIPYNLTLAGSSDDLAHSLNYGALCKTVQLCFGEEAKFESVEAAANQIAEACFAGFPTLMRLRIRVEKPRAALRAKSVAVEVERARLCGLHALNPDVFLVNDLELCPIIGVNPWEREAIQPVIINMSLEPPSSLDSPFDYPRILREVTDVVLKSSYLTIEAFVTKIAEIALQSSVRVTVRAAKPCALMFAAASEVSIVRRRGDVLYPLLAASHRVAIAVGSNMGDRFGSITAALEHLELAGVRILWTSFLYETAPMYVTDQETFINGACLVETTLGPLEFLQLLKRVEDDVGRVPSFRNGPRAIDLDIVFWGPHTFNTRASAGASETSLDLVIPHERLHEREFVLRPLADILPDFVHPILHRTVRDLLEEVTVSQGSTARRVIDFPGPNASSTRWNWGERTFIMATLNVTPDSFSDGGDHAAVSDAVRYAEAAAHDGADIIDIGGYSTRPGAQDIPEAEEIARVIPAVQAIRAAGISLPISVDTFRAAVAEQAVRAGANCINDVTAMRHDPDMAATAARLRVPVILMHSRGPADQNKQYDDVVRDVRRELGDATRLAMDAGVRRWNIIADPGVGFSKTVDGNATVLRQLRWLTAAEGPVAAGALPHPLEGLPTLAGVSRKSFLAKLIGRDAEPKERDFATSAAVVASIQQGIDIVRVHNVAALRDAVKVADAIWRRI